METEALAQIILPSPLIGMADQLSHHCRAGIIINTDSLAGLCQCQAFPPERVRPSVNVNTVAISWVADDKHNRALVSPPWRTPKPPFTIMRIGTIKTSNGDD